MSKALVPFVRVARTALLALILVTCESRVFNANAPEGTTTRIAIVANGELAAAVDRARQGARHRLDRGSCARVTSQFTDARGSSLDEILAERGASAAESLARLVFRDGDAAPTCRLGPIAAFTSPGSDVVFVCGKRFARMNSQRAELVIIHELLHTLGLQERPPLPVEIDQAVANRCDR